MKDKIKELSLDKNMKEQLIKILVNSEFEDDQEYFNQDNDIYENISSSEYSIKSEKENCEFKACSCNRLNVISKYKNILLDLVDSIEDPELQKKYLIKIREKVTEYIKIQTPNFN